MIQRTYPNPNEWETKKIINRPLYKSAKYKGRAALEAIKAKLERAKNDK
jgi:hypothetical protein